MTKKTRQPTITSPAGIASYPHLSEPDSKFSDQEPKYKVGLRLDPNEPAAAKFLADLDARYEAALPAMKEAFPKFAARMKLEFPPYKPEYDKEGNDTGFVLVSFACKAFYVAKESGKKVSLKPKLFDAKNKLIDVNIGGGSTIKVAFTPNPFAFSNTKVGVSLRLEAVQVLDLVQFGDRRASPFGEEEGYEGEDAPFGDPAESSSAGTAGSDGPDF